MVQGWFDDFEFSCARASMVSLVAQLFPHLTVFQQYTVARDLTAKTNAELGGAHLPPVDKK